MHNKTLAQLSTDLHHKHYSSVELTQHYVQRIKQFNPELNCFITITEQQALEQAAQADKQLANGTAGPLTGIPIAHKDIFCTDGVKTSCGSKMLDNFIAPYDATVVTCFKQAGTVLLGKTNMDEFAMGSSTETSYYGPVKNPWSLAAVPGGSSGGSAVAVAAGLAAACTGTDTGGSIRQPASLCGITGIKPTYGRVSRYGMIAFASSLDQGGPMTRTAEDAALLLNAMAGHDPRDSTSVNEPVPDYTKTLNEPLNTIRVGLPKQFFSQELDPHIAQTIETAVVELEKLGVRVKEVDLPHMHLAPSVYYVIAPAECSSNLARYDGVRYGYRCTDPVDLADLYKRSRGEGFGAEVKRRIMIGTYVLSAGYYDSYYLKAQKIRRLIRDDFARVLTEVDLLIGPATPAVGFNLGEKVDDPINMYLSDIYTLALNLAGLPGMSIPVGFSDQEHPIGMQLIGNYFEEARLLNVAHQYQQVTDWHQHTPTDYMR